jgi:hypothetical protein
VGTWAKRVERILGVTNGLRPLPLDDVAGTTDEALEAVAEVAVVEFLVAELGKDVVDSGDRHRKVGMVGR